MLAVGVEIVCLPLWRCTLPNIDRASMRVVALIDNFATFVLLRGVRC